MKEMMIMRVIMIKIMIKMMMMMNNKKIPKRKRNPNQKINKIKSKVDLLHKNHNVNNNDVYISIN